MAIRRKSPVDNSRAGGSFHPATAERRDRGTHRVGSRRSTRAYALRKAVAGTTALTAAALCGHLLVTDLALALPTDGTVVEGEAEIIYGDNSVTIRQGSDRVVIEWQTFDIAAHESVDFIQPSALAAALNRVLSGDASQILGTLTANGQVFISNPAGVVFGPEANIDVASIVATSLDIMNRDFMESRLDFSIAGDPTAVVENHGSISASGLAALVGPGARNAGAIVADVVILGGGQGFALDYYGDGLVNFTITDPTTARPVDAAGSPLDALVINDGTILADGGQVILTADAAAGVIDTVINLDGVVQARSVEARNGQVALVGGDVGAVTVAGTIDATGDDAGETGGTVHVLGDTVRLADGAVVDVSGRAGGGTALIGGAAGGGAHAPTDALAYRAPASGGRSGTTIVMDDAFQSDGFIPTADIVYFEAGATAAADATEAGNGGTVIAWANEEAHFHGTITARGGQASGDGGFVEVSGAALAFGGTVDTSAPNGTYGELLIDPLVIDVCQFGPGCAAPAVGLLPDVTLSALLALNDVTLNASVGGAGAGEPIITFQTGASVTWTSGTDLNVIADDALGGLAPPGSLIDIQAGVTISGDNASASANGPANVGLLAETINLGSTLQIDGSLSGDTATPDSGVATTVNVGAGGSVQQGIDVANNVIAGVMPTVTVAAGTFAETVVIDRSLTLAGANNELIDPNTGVRGDESEIAGGILVDAGVSGVTIAGLTIAEGASILGETAGVYLNNNADGVTIENTIFSRTGGFGGARGIVTSSAGVTDIDIVNNSFTGWATGVYINPQSDDVVVQGNVFDANNVGMSHDGPSGPIGVTIDGNTFANSAFEALGLGGTATRTITGNSFQDNPVHIGAYGAAGVPSLDDLMTAGNTFDRYVTTDLDGDGGRAATQSVYGQIQPAIDDSGAGATVTASAGTFTESVVIDKALTLVGDGSGNTTTISITSGIGMHVTGIAGGGTVDISGFRFEGNDTAQFGILADVTAELDQLLIDDVYATGFYENGIAIQGSQSTGTASPIAYVGISNTVLEDNGRDGTSSAVAGSKGRGDLQLFFFNGDADLTNVTIVGGGEGRYGIQLRGVDTGFPSGTQAMGEVAFSGVSVTGDYFNEAITDPADIDRIGNGGPLVGIQGYSNADGLSFTDVTIGGDGSTSAWGTGLYLSQIATGGPSSFSLGNTHFGNINGDLGAFIVVLGSGGTPEPDLIIDATDASFDGVAVDGATADELVAIESRVFHHADDTVNGLVDFGALVVDGGTFHNSLQLAVNLAGSTGIGNVVVGTSTLDGLDGAFGGSVELWVDGLKVTGATGAAIDVSAVDAHSNFGGDVDAGFVVADEDNLVDASGGPDAEVTGVNIDPITFTGTGVETGVQLGTATSAAVDATVDSNVFATLLDGIVSVNSTGVTLIRGNVMTGIAGSGIRIADTVAGGEDLHIVGNDVGAAGAALLFEGVITDLDTLVRVEDNRLVSTGTGDAADGIAFAQAIQGEAAVRITANREISGTDGIDVSQVDNAQLTVSGNTLVTGTTEAIEFGGAVGNGAVIEIRDNDDIIGAAAGIGFVGAGTISSGASVTISGNNDGIAATAGSGVLFATAITDAAVTIGDGNIIDGDGGSGVRFQSSITGSTIDIVGNSSIQGTDSGIDFTETFAGGSILRITDNTEIIGDGSAEDSDAIDFRRQVNADVTIAGNTLVQGADDGIQVVEGITGGTFLVQLNSDITGLDGEGIALLSNDGSDPPLATTAISGGAVVTIDRNRITGNEDTEAVLDNPGGGGDGLLISGAIIGGSTLTVTGSTITGFLDGINVFGNVTDSTVMMAENTIDGMVDDGIDFGGQTTGSTVTIRGHRSEGGAGITAADEGVVFLLAVTDSTITIADNSIEAGFDGVLFNGGPIADSTVVIGGPTAEDGNHIVGGDDGIDVDTLVGGTFTVSHNTRIEGTASDGIEFETTIDGTVVDILDNGLITGGGFDGILFDGTITGATVQIARNDIEGAVEGLDIAEISGGTFSIVDNVRIEGLVDDGIEFETTVSGGARVEILGNALIRGGDDGVEFGSTPAETPPEAVIGDATVVIAGNNAGIVGTAGDGISLAMTLAGATVLIGPDGDYGGNVIEGGLNGISVSGAVTGASTIDIVANQRIAGVAADGISFTGDLGSQSVVTIDGNTLIEGGRHGVSAFTTVANTLLISNNAGPLGAAGIVANGGSGIFVDPGVGATGDVDILDNVIDASAGADPDAPASGHGVFLQSVDAGDVLVQGNEIDAEGAGVRLFDTASAGGQLRILDNLIGRTSAVGRHGVWLGAITGATTLVQIGDDDLGNRIVAAEDGVHVDGDIDAGTLRVSSNAEAEPDDPAGDGIIAGDDGIELAAGAVGGGLVEIDGNEIRAGADVDNDGVRVAGTVSGGAEIRVANNPLISAGHIGVRLDGAITGATVTITGNNDGIFTGVHGVFHGGPITGSTVTIRRNIIDAGNTAGADGDGVHFAGAIVDSEIDVGGATLADGNFITVGQPGAGDGTTHDGVFFGGEISGTADVLIGSNDIDVLTGAGGGAFSFGDMGIRFDGFVNTNAGGTAGVRIADNRIRGGGGQEDRGIAFWGGIGGGSSVDIADNDIQSGDDGIGLFDLLAPAGPDDQAVRGNALVTIEGNRIGGPIQANPGNGIIVQSVTGASRLIVVDNSVFAEGNGILFEGLVDTTFGSGTPLAAPTFGIEVTDNDLVSETADGVRISGGVSGSHMQLADNRIEGHVHGVAIGPTTVEDPGGHLTNSALIAVSGNAIEGVTQNGVQVGSDVLDSTVALVGNAIEGRLTGVVFDGLISGAGTDILVVLNPHIVGQQVDGVRFADVTGGSRVTIAGNGWVPEDGSTFADLATELGLSADIVGLAGLVPEVSDDTPWVDWALADGVAGGTGWGRGDDGVDFAGEITGGAQVSIDANREIVGHGDAGIVFNGVLGGSAVEITRNLRITGYDDGIRFASSETVPGYGVHDSTVLIALNGQALIDEEDYTGEQPVTGEDDPLGDLQAFQPVGSISGLTGDGIDFDDAIGAGSAVTIRESIITVDRVELAENGNAEIPLIEAIEGGDQGRWCRRNRYRRRSGR